MAGNGPPPKDPSQRVRRAAPARGEWIELPPVDEPVLTKSLPKRAPGTGPWHPRTKAAWAAWRMDPATTQYGPAEIAGVIDLAHLHDSACRGGEKWSEVRLRMDGLGLSAKGKRDLRWRAPTETAAQSDTAADSPTSSRDAKVVDISSRIRAS